MSDKRLIPTGLTYLADNIISKDNILGASKATGTKWAKNLNLPKESETTFFAGCGYQHTGELESLMSLIRRMDKSAIGAERVMSLAGFQKKLGIDAAGVYRKVMAGGSDAEAQPLKDAVKVLDRLGVKVGYLAEEEPCCGGLLHYIGLQKEFAKHGREVYDRLKSKGVKRIISII
ncbi:heterodisulfide reductase-related iron-sulfur binding cluster, partial [Chloroflexota bacterium]